MTEQRKQEAWQKKVEAQRKMLTTTNRARRQQLLTVVEYWSAIYDRLSVN